MYNDNGVYPVFKSITFQFSGNQKHLRITGCRINYTSSKLCQLKLFKFKYASSNMPVQIYQFVYASSIMAVHNDAKSIMSIPFQFSYAFSVIH